MRNRAENLGLGDYGWPRSIRRGVRPAVTSPFIITSAATNSKHSPVARAMTVPAAGSGERLEARNVRR